MTTEPLVNELILLTVAGEQVNDLTQRLRQSGFYSTLVDSRGGLVEERTSTVLIGIDRSQRAAALGIVRETCRRQMRLVPAQLEAPSLAYQPLMIETETGGAVVYTLPIDAFHRL
ncbi:MAG TPA: cyclic-di-AMP receptor [Anaerolineales bacterium]|nr:cyclic-di-AMP receptor [Anaerolineales bacterium]HRF46771.1 cyclic-di-AMP receptor [Anaerolineales bacterium]